MKTKAQRWGNSLAVRIPKAIAEEAGLQEEDELDIEVVAKVIRMKLRQVPGSLDDLLGRITDENIHGEADFRNPQGREAQ